MNPLAALSGQVRRDKRLLSFILIACPKSKSSLDSHGMSGQAPRDQEIVPSEQSAVHANNAAEARVSAVLTAPD